MLFMGRKPCTEERLGPEAWEAAPPRVAGDPWAGLQGSTEPQRSAAPLSTGPGQVLCSRTAASATSSVRVQGPSPTRQQCLDPETTDGCVSCSKHVLCG